MPGGEAKNFILGKKVVIAGNPRSGSRNRTDLLHAFASLVKKRGGEAALCWSLDEFEARVHRTDCAGDLGCVVAAGGDGTVSAVAQRIREDIPVAILPLGTENLLARENGLTADPSGLVETLCKGTVRSLDAGTANGQLFLIMASVGFDSEVVRQVHSSRRGHIRPSSYYLPIAKSVFTYPFPMIEVTSSSGTRQVAWLFVFNQPRYAGELSIAPWADPCDGKLDVCAFVLPGVWHGLRYWYHLVRNRHQTLPDFFTEQTNEIKVTSSFPVSFQIDGDAGGQLPLHLQVLPKRLQLIVPGPSR